MASTLIQSVRLVDPLGQREWLADVRLTDGHIQSVEAAVDGERDRGGDGLRATTAADDTPAAGLDPDLGPDLEPDRVPDLIIDGRGCVLGPGLIDLYSHSGEPGHESRETLAALAASARAGGFTRVGILPTTVPAIDTVAQVKELLRHQPQAQPRLMPWAASTVAAAGERLNELVTLAGSGMVGFSDGRSQPPPALLRRLLEYAQPLGYPIAIWPCDRTQTGLMRDGADAVRLGLPGLPATSETVPLARVLELVADTLTPVHIMRVSTARSVELIRGAKQRGLPVTASVVWLHLLRSTQAMAAYDPHLRLDPPLGTPADQQALITGLEEGVLDAIATDHIAYTYEEKTVPFGVAPPGALGLPLVLSLLWEAFVATNRWQPWQLWRYLSTQPAQCLNQTAPTTQPRQPSELVLFDPTVSWTVTPDSLKSLSQGPAYNTAWLGQTLQGSVVKVWLPSTS